jgi:thiamine biosynthesis lipoprotein
VNTETFRAMGCEVVVAGAGRRARAAIERLFADRERMFSRFLPASELTSVNASAGRPTVVSAEFAGMLSRSLALAADTDGLVDPTVGAALAALGYTRDLAALGDDPAPAGPSAPAPGWRSVELSGRLLVMPAGCALDLNGVVKSATVDDAVALLDGDGFVSAGGDLAVRGPTTVSLPGGGAVAVVQGGIATSGTTKRRWRRAGEVHHHLVDPATGRSAASPWEAVTASGITCVAADVAARAAFLAGEDGPGWLDRRGIPGRFLAADGTIDVNRAWAATAGEPACT